MVSLDELARQAQELEQPGGLFCCRRCGCRHFRVESTRLTPAGIRRRRVCRNCGQDAVITVEILSPKSPTRGG